jgi:hypothetical protein
MTPTLSKIHQFLTPAERKSAAVLLGLMVVGMVLETLGIGLVIPAIALLMQDDLAARYPSVAHRLSTVEHCDRLYWLEPGRVPEEGSTYAMRHQRRESITRDQA